MSIRNCSIALMLGIASLASQATQQCFTTAGAYGAVTTTLSGDCSAIFPYNTRTGYVLSNAQSCTINFNKPIVTSSVSVDLDNVDPIEVTTISTSAGAYAVLGGDLTGPLFPGDLGSLSASGGNIVSTVITASGRFTFTNSPPASITSLTLTHAGAAGTVYRVCADDADAVPPAPVPTLSEWAMITFAMLIVGFGIYQQRRRQY